MKTVTTMLGIHCHSGKLQPNNEIISVFCHTSAISATVLGRICMGRLGYMPSLLYAEFVMDRVCHVPSLIYAELSLNPVGLYF